MKGYRPVMPTVGVALALVLLITACTLPSTRAGEPQAGIVSPLDGSTVLLGDTIVIRALVNDSNGIAWVQLWVDDQPAGNIVTPVAPVTQLTQDLLWTPNAAGQHTVKLVAQNNTGGQTESEPIILYVSADASLRATAIAVQLATATPNPFAVATPLPTFTFTPAPPATSTSAPTATSTPALTATPVPCYDSAAFVVDVTVPDGSQLDKKTSFSKVWRLCNTGTCAWDTGYQFVFVGGAQLNGPSPTTLPHTVSPGSTVDITVPMVAPDATGTYRSEWQMRNPDGIRFGTIVHALIEVRPGPDDPPIITRFEVVPNVISQGQSATIYWGYVNGIFARLTPGGEGGVGPTGSLTVSPNATTSYRLVVNNGAGTVERTITLVVQPRPAPPPAPASPANLAIAATKSDGFDFTWTDTSTDEQGFRLYNADTRQALVTFPSNVVGGAVGGLACQTSYRFYLIAFNEGGESWPSNTVQATTGACGG